MAFLENILRSPSCFATTAITLAIRDFGTDLLYWEPETIELSLEKRYGEIPLFTLNKINVAKNIITTDYYYHLLDHFILYNNVLSKGSADDYKNSLDELCWGLTETQLLFPRSIPSSPNEIFSSEIVAYMFSILKEEGILLSPKILLLAGIQIDTLQPSLEPFSSDPTFFESITQVQIDKRDYYDNFVMARLRELHLQLSVFGVNIDIEDIKRLLLP